MFDHIWMTIDYTWDGVWKARWRSDHRPVNATSCARHQRRALRTAGAQSQELGPLEGGMQLPRERLGRVGPQTMVDVQSRCQYICARELEFLIEGREEALLRETGESLRAGQLQAFRRRHAQLPNGSERRKVARAMRRAVRRLRSLRSMERFRAALG